MLAGYRHRNEHGRPVFAFRLHPFISRGERVYTSPEPEAVRCLTPYEQPFVPGADRAKVLLPLAFCRACGEAYDVVERKPGGRRTHTLRAP